MATRFDWESPATMERFLLQEAGVRRELERIAASVVDDANRATRAPVQIAWHWLGDQVHIGPRGAPGIVMEYGGRHTPARRMVKRALDRHQIA